MIRLEETNTQSHVEIDPMGCRILDVSLHGTRVLWSGERPGGGMGSTHICVPNFDKAEGLPNHGPARNEAWQDEQDGILTWIMEPIDGMYPGGLEVRRRHQLASGEFRMMTHVTNSTGEDVRINLGEHHYFPCPVGKQAEVLVNGEPFGPLAADDQTQYREIGAENTWEIRELGTIHFIQSGYTHVALWSLSGAEYVCIEPIQMIPPKPDKFFDEAVVLAEDQKMEFSYSLSLL